MIPLEFHLVLDKL